MRCFNCGVNLDNNSKYCPRCGTLFSQDKDIKEYCEREDIKYIDIYYSDIDKHVYFYNISLGFLFFSFLYAFYKKMYFEGLYSFLGFCLFVFLFLYWPTLFAFSIGFMAIPIIFGFILSLFVYFYFLFNFNNLYVSNIKKRISYIVNNNPNANEEEIIRLCEIDSKPNVIFTSVFGIIVLLLLILIFWFRF